MSKAEISEITAWRASDHSLHATREAAEKHSEAVAIGDVIRAHYCSSDPGSASYILHLYADDIGRVLARAGCRVAKP